MLKPYACLALFCSLLLPSFAHADDSDVGCVTTEWKLLGANHKVCVSAFNDPDIPGVACYISQAKTGGVSGFAKPKPAVFPVRSGLPKIRPTSPFRAVRSALSKFPPSSPNRPTYSVNRPRSFSRPPASPASGTPSATRSSISRSAAASWTARPSTRSPRFR